MTMPARRRSRIAQGLWCAGGLVAFGCAVLGAILPLIPTVPFLLLAALCFARSSERWERWFHGTRLYREVLQDYVSKREMTVRAKLRLMVPVSAMIFVAMAFVPLLWVRGVMFCVWLGHVWYFAVKVPTIPQGASPQEA